MQQQKDGECPKSSRSQPSVQCWVGRTELQKVKVKEEEEMEEEEEEEEEEEAGGSKISD